MSNDTLVLNADGTMEYRGWNVVKVTKDRWDADRGGEAISKRSKKALLAEIDTRSTRESALDEDVTDVPASDASPVGKALKRAPKSRRQREEDLVGNKITRTMVRDIRAGWYALGGDGKMAYYKATAAKYGLGLETVAKISRGDIYPSESLGLTAEELGIEEEE